MHTVWPLPIALALHEAEEWYIHGWYVRNYIGLPEGRTPTTIRFFLVFLSLFGFAWAGLALAWGEGPFTAWILLPLLGLIVQNVVQHIYWQLVFKEYAPGIITSLLLLLPLSGWYAYSWLEAGWVPFWYVIVIAGAMTPGLVETVTSRNQLTRSILAIHRFSRWSVNALGLQKGERSSS